MSSYQFAPCWTQSCISCEPPVRLKVLLQVQQVSSVCSASERFMCGSASVQEKSSSSSLSKSDFISSSEHNTVHAHVRLQHACFFNRHVQNNTCINLVPDRIQSQITVFKLIHLLEHFRKSSVFNIWSGGKVKWRNKDVFSDFSR